MAVARSAANVAAWRGEWGLWFRWVAANAVGEALGLGTTALVGLGLFAALGEGTGVLATLTVAAAAVVAGTIIEGVTVGTAQWLVLRRPLPGVSWGVWAGATAAGAAVAWTLGMLPSTLLSLGQQPGAATPAEPSAAVVYALAVAMGLVLGPVLVVGPASPSAARGPLDARQCPRLGVRDGADLRCGVCGRGPWPRPRCHRARRARPRGDRCGGGRHSRAGAGVAARPAALTGAGG